MTTILKLENKTICKFDIEKKYSTMNTPARSQTNHNDYGYGR